MRTFILFLFGTIIAAADDVPKFRTDESPDKSLPWYQPVAGKFPPEGSAHYIMGELIKVDHCERQLIIRVDRNDSQQRGVWDLPLILDMLPYGSIYYHGAPASLFDIPLGTHLHTWCYVKSEKDERPPLATFHHRISPESAFRQCLRIEDDFTYHARQKQSWKIDKIDIPGNKLTATLQQDGKPTGGPKLFDLTPSTIVYFENGFGTLKNIQPGQVVQMNLTWVTLYGPGRVFQIWLDEKSRAEATARQFARHQHHIRERGIPGWIEAVDDETQIITITFFDGIDPGLFKDLSVINPEPLGWPTSGGAKNDLAPKGTVAVARECLMTYDPTNDRKGGNILKISEVPVRPGCSGVQIQLECDMLLEGFRPTKIVRFYPASWPFVTLPMEESFFGRE